MDQARGTKRWVPTDSAKALLETIFKADSFPKFTVRQSLATQLGIDARQVQIWFQNRRQRERSKMGKMRGMGTQSQDEGDDARPACTGPCTVPSGSTTPSLSLAGWSTSAGTGSSASPSTSAAASEAADGVGPSAAASGEPSAALDTGAESGDGPAADNEHHSSTDFASRDSTGRGSASTRSDSQGGVAACASLRESHLGRAAGSLPLEMLAGRGRGGGCGGESAGRAYGEGEHGWNYAARDERAMAGERGVETPGGRAAMGGWAAAGGGRSPRALHGGVRMPVLPDAAPPALQQMLDTPGGSRALAAAARSLLLNNPILQHPGAPCHALLTQLASLSQSSSHSSVPPPPVSSQAPPVAPTPPPPYHAPRSAAVPDGSNADGTLSHAAACAATPRGSASDFPPAMPPEALASETLPPETTLEIRPEIPPEASERSAGARHASELAWHETHQSLGATPDTAGALRRTTSSEAIEALLEIRRC